MATRQGKQASDQPQNDSALLSRLMRYYQQSIARQLLPGEKVAKCARVIRPNKTTVEVAHVPDKQTAYFRNLIICGRVWTCPVCAAKVNERRRKELAMLIYTTGFRPVLVTYTLSHQRRDRLHVLLDAIQTALAFTRNGRPYRTTLELYGIVGTVRSYEITYGSSGWHPHAHEIVMMAGETTDAEVEAYELWLRARWQQALTKSGRAAGFELGVAITKHDGDIAAYIAKFGREPARAGWTITHELAKSNAKTGKQDGRTPFELLLGKGKGVHMDGVRFQEYARVFKNVHPLHWSKGLKKLLHDALPEKTDEQAAQDDPDEYIVLAKLEPSAWKVILSRERRGELLNIASTGNKQAVLDYLSDIGINHVDLSLL